MTTQENLEELRRDIAALPKPQREKIERLSKSLRRLVNLYGHDGMIALSVVTLEVSLASELQKGGGE